MAEGKFISYLRVSTERQGASGLGLEAQRSAVDAFLNGGSWELLAEYREIETGKRNDRPELVKALVHCRRAGATLVTAKLDRLARNVAFVANLMESGADFVACDFPQANRLTIHILAAVAEHEAKMISERTKAALAAARTRGVKLGNPNGTDVLRRYVAEHGNGKAVEAVKAKAQGRAADYRDIIEETADQPLQAAARALNQRGILAPRGGRWTATAVRRLRGACAQPHELFGALNWATVLAGGAGAAMVGHGSSRHKIFRFATVDHGRVNSPKRPLAGGPPKGARAIIAPASVAERTAASAAWGYCTSLPRSNAAVVPPSGTGLASVVPSPALGRASRLRWCCS